MGARQGTVIITGGSGLIGTAAAARLAASFDVVGFDVEKPSHAPPGVEGVIVDITSDESVRDGLGHVRERHGDRIASVVHLAVYYDFSGEPSPKYDEITVRGTERLLRALKEFSVEQLVFSSSTLVHAPCEPGRRIDEDWPLEPKWNYPRSKVRAEELIHAGRGAVPAVILRIAGIYDDRGHSIPIAHQIQRIYKRWLTSRVFPGDTSHGQPYVHLDDLMDALARVVERRRQLPDELTLLIGEPETLSYDELQRELGRLIHGEEWETREIPKAVAKAGAWVQDALPLGEEPFIKPWMIDLADDHLELDITRARTRLGWEPERSLRRTLPRMVAALEADPAGWYRENKLEVPSWLAEGVEARATGSAGVAEAR
jgi:nucleoside-diphosphate-sugar epimerase